MLQVALKAKVNIHGFEHEMDDFYARHTSSWVEVV